MPESATGQHNRSILEKLSGDYSLSNGKILKSNGKIEMCWNIIFLYHYLLIIITGNNLIYLSDY